MRISDWSSDVCSSDLARHYAAVVHGGIWRMEVEIAEVGEVAETVEIADANAPPRARDRPRAFQFLQRAVDMHRREPEQIGELLLRYRKVAFDEARGADRKIGRAHV